MAKLTWDDLIKDYQSKGYKIYDYRKMNADKPASTWGDATIGVHGSGNSVNAAPTNSALNNYHLTSGRWKDQDWVRINRDPWQVGAGVYNANPIAGPQIAYAGPVGGTPHARTQAALDASLAYLRKHAPDRLKYVKGHGELYAGDKRYSKRGRGPEEGRWAKGWESRVIPAAQPITSAEAQHPAPPIQRMSGTIDFSEIKGSLPEKVEIPEHSWGDVASEPEAGPYGDVTATVQEIVAPKPVQVGNAGRVAAFAQPAVAPKGVPAAAPETAFAEKTGPHPPAAPKRAAWANEDLSPPMDVGSGPGKFAQPEIAPAAPVPLPVSPGPTPQRLRPDETSDWVQWQHGQMQGALNTGPTKYVPPGGPQPVKPVNMQLSNILGGFKFW